MKGITKIAALLFLLVPGIALAEGEEGCNISSCSAGEKLVSYSDGNNSSCHCAPEAQMEDTVDVLTDDGVVDPNNID